MCKVNRKFGAELEGYVDTNLEDEVFHGWEGTEDGSLNNSEDECNNCDSDGESWEECRECEGSGEHTEECSVCDGTGYWDCADCEGKGYTVDDEGEEISCDWCHNGHVDCEDCGGSGEVSRDCYDCDGRGERYYTCSTCNGEHYLSSGRFGIEFVSPVLEDMDTFRPLFDTLEYYCWEVDNTCGTHIHVNGEDFSPNDVRKLTYFMSAIEPIFYGLVTSSRMGGSYSKLLDHSKAYKIIENENINWDDLALAYYGRERVRDSFSKYESERYYALNLHSWFYRSTFEFRYFNGCDDIDDLKLYVELCTKVVDFCKNATMEQLIPIVDKFYQLYSNNRLETTHVLEEVLGLESNIILTNRNNFDKYINDYLFDRYEFDTQIAIDDIAV